jgi:WhiB family redox-sensing transcriptional regulator
MIDMACRSDDDIFKAPLRNPVAAGHIIGELEEEIDPAEQALAARWLRRERPRGWKALLDALGLPEGGPLTSWDDDPAASLREARTADVAPAPVAEVTPIAPRPEPARLPVRPRGLDGRRPSMPRPDWNWQDDAACSGEDLMVFFGPDWERQPERDVRERKAKAICSQCPVRRECLNYALSKPEKYGTWGNLNEDERASEKRRRQRSGTPTWARREAQGVA